MKRIILLGIFILISAHIFAQNADLPTFLIETNTGYSVGVNLNNAMQVDTKLVYSFEKMAMAVEIGGLFSGGYSAFHFFIAPLYYFINNENWRLPLAIGFDFMKTKGGGNEGYFGIGSEVSIQRRFTKYLYAGFNLGIIYAFNHVYDEVTGYKTTKEVVDDGTGNAVFREREVPVIETKNHYGNNFYFKPSLAIGLQF